MGQENTNTSTNTPAEPTFKDRVDEVVGKMVKNDKDVWEIPKDVAEDLPEEIKYAATLEKRFRDTQGHYTKTNKRLKELETVNSKLESHLVETATNHLTPEQRDELDELKLRDPDAWREKLNEHEQTAKQLLQERIEAYRKEGLEMSELEVRKHQLEAFTERTGIELNDDIIADELPARYSKQLEKGEITFEQFLEKAQKFLTKEKVIAGSEDEPKKKTSLDGLPGGATPTETAQHEDIKQTYKKTVF